MLLIIGAVTDMEQLAEVLPCLTDFELFISLWNGEGGNFAQQWTDRHLRQVLEKIDAEISSSEFELLEDHLAEVDFKKQLFTQWTHNEYALLYALSGLMVQGVFLSDFFELVSRMDEKCRTEQQRLQEEAKVRRISLRSALFSAAYIGTHTGEAAITKIFSDLYSGMATFTRPRNVTRDVVKQLLKKGLLNYGEFYLLLLLLRWREDIQVLYPYILSALQKHWRQLPYYLTSETLQQAPYAYSEEEQRQDLVDALNQMHNETQNVWLSTKIFEALADLGALVNDAEAYVETVAGEISALLTTPEDKDAWNKAAGAFDAQFDHPYATAYRQAISELKEPGKKTFYLIALQGDHGSFFTISLIRNAWELYGGDIAPYLVRWIENPFIEPSFPQGSLAIFFVSHILLAQSNYPIESKSTGETNKRIASIFAAAELIYWLNRDDLEVSQKQDACLAAKRTLFAPDNLYVMETIWQLRHNLHQTGIYHNVEPSAITILTKTYSEHIVIACREAIANPGSQQDINDFPRDRIIDAHAISLLAETGSLIDRDILYPLADHPVYGRDVVRAIKALSENFS